MWLSSVGMLNPLFLGGRLTWDDGQWAHRRVMRLFNTVEGGAPRQNLGVLFRVEPECQGRVLIQSREQPKLFEGVTTIEASRLLDAVEEGKRFIVKVKLNNMKTVNKGEDRKPVRQAIPEEDSLNWATGKLPFMSLCELITFETNIEKGPNRSPLSTCTIQGVFTIRNAEETKKAVLEGVGRAKAFGCGMVSLAKI